MDRKGEVYFALGVFGEKEKYMGPTDPLTRRDVSCL